MTDTWTEPFLLTVRQQKQFVRLILQGAAPSAVAVKLGVPLESVRLTCDVDSKFRRQMQHLRESLNDNVRAAIYRQALKGNVSAQTLWLKDDAQRAVGAEQRVGSPGELLTEIEDLHRALTAGTAEGPQS